MLIEPNLLISCKDTKILEPIASYGNKLGPQKNVADLEAQLVYKTMRADSYDTLIDSRLRRVGRAYFMRNSARIQLRKHNLGDIMEECL